jgi:hypothetical protein
VFEQVPAEHLGGSEWRLTGTPGIALGCAEGDVLVLDDDGRYAVCRRGGNMSILIYGVALDRVVGPLRSAFKDVGGRVEAPQSLRFVVATIPASVGFETVERAIVGALDGVEGIEWFYGNVYDELNRPLNWWCAPQAAD